MTSISEVSAFAFGGAVVIEPETQARYKLLYCVFVNGIAGIVAEQIKLIKPLSPKHHLVFGEDDKFCKKQ